MSLISSWQRFLAMPNENPIKAIVMAALVAIASATLVSTTVVLLKPRQLANLESLRQQQMQSMLSALPGLEDVLQASGVDALLTRVVELESGEFSTVIDAQSFDSKKIANDPELSIALTPTEDIAGIGRRERFVPVHLLLKQNELELVVLPVYGKGYQSTIRAWLALAGDLDTVVALSIFEQAETPGLGTRIEEPDWLALWRDKRLHDDAGAIALNVVKGNASGVNEVDGISGATRTGNGINNMLAFWLTETGFGPFFDNLSSGKLTGFLINE